MKIDKNKLCALNIFDNNSEYLDKYVDLINKNEKTIYIKYKTQDHHIIPKAYYVYNNLDIDNSPDNMVTLLYKDHILAHYYLAMACNNKHLKFSNEYACLFMLYTDVIPLDENIVLLNLDKYQELYEEYKILSSEMQKGKKLSVEHLDNIRAASKKRIGVTLSDNHKRKISDKITGIKRGPLTDEHRQKLSEAAKHRKHNSTKGRISIYNKELNIKKYIQKELLEQYIEDGWVLGGTPQTEKTKQIIGKNTTKCLSGTHRSQLSNKKTSETLKQRWKEKNYQWRKK